MKTLTLILMLMLAPVVVACGDDTGDATDSIGSGLPQGSETVALDPADFTVDIDNRYWPMPVGTRWTYREIDEEDAISPGVLRG